MHERSVKEQKVLEVRLERSSESISNELNLIGADGFEYGGMMRFLDRAGGGIYVIKAQGVYTFRAMIWLNPSSKLSTFHIHRFMQRRNKINLTEKIIETTAEENKEGFKLREALPMEGFVSKEGYRHPGTAGCFLLFEKQDYKDKPHKP